MPNQLAVAFVHEGGKLLQLLRGDAGGEEAHGVLHTPFVHALVGVGHEPPLEQVTQIQHVDLFARTDLERDAKYACSLRAAKKPENQGELNATCAYVGNGFRMHHECGDGPKFQYPK